MRPPCILKDQIIEGVLAREKGYVNDPLDSGRETNFGVTVATARAFGYTGPMIDMPREVAVWIYTAEYWDAVRADDLLALSPAVAEEVVDTSINTGPDRAGRFLQRALNVLNDRTRAYADILVDGQIGSKTLVALRLYLARRDEDVLVNMLNCLQGSFYVRLAEKREKDERFIYGWFKKRVSLL